MGKNKHNNQYINLLQLLKIEVFTDSFDMWRTMLYIRSLFPYLLLKIFYITKYFNVFFRVNPHFRKFPYGRTPISYK